MATSFPGLFPFAGGKSPGNEVGKMEIRLNTFVKFKKVSFQENTLEEACEEHGFTCKP